MKYYLCGNKKSNTNEIPRKNNPFRLKRKVTLNPEFDTETMTDIPIMIVAQTYPELDVVPTSTNSLNPVIEEESDQYQEQDQTSEHSEKVKETEQPEEQGSSRTSVFDQILNLLDANEASTQRIRALMNIT